MKDKLWERRCAKDLLQLKPLSEETFRESFPISATSTLMLKLIVSSRKHFSLRLRVIVFDTAFPLKKNCFISTVHFHYIYCLHRRSALLLSSFSISFFSLCVWIPWLSLKGWNLCRIRKLLLIGKSALLAVCKISSFAFFVYSSLIIIEILPLLNGTS